LVTPAGTNPIHNKKPKKKAQDLDEDDLAYKAKLAAGAYHISRCLRVPPRLRISGRDTKQ
jgi:hypothetical protein